MRLSSSIYKLFFFSFQVVLVLVNAVPNAILQRFQLKIRSVLFTFNSPAEVFLRNSLAFNSVFKYSIFMFCSRKKNSFSYILKQKAKGLPEK